MLASEAGESARAVARAGSSALAFGLHLGDHVGDRDDDRIRPVFFKLNGQSRTIEIQDRSFVSQKKTNRKVAGAQDVGSPLQGKVSKVLVKEGAAVEKDSPLFLIEAMKMETTVNAPRAGMISKIVLQPGSLVEQDDVVVEFAA